MPAYTRSIEHRCQTCGGRATVEAFNTRNASLGYFCTPCGNERVRRLNAATP